MIQNEIKRPQGGINYGALFTGEAKLEIAAVNPNKEQLVKIKGLENIEDQVKEPEYTGIDLNENLTNMTKLSFYFTFNPNEQIKHVQGEKRFEDSVVVNYDIFISDKKVVTKDGKKIQVIDQHNQSTYVLYDQSLSTKEMVKAHMKQLEDNGQKKSYVYQLLSELDLDSVRHAHQGEVLLYDMMFQLSTLPKHKPDRPLNKFVLSTPGTKYEDISVKPEDVDKEFKKVLNGDVSYIRHVINDDVCKTADGSQVKVWGMLGAVENNGKYYQDILSSPIHCCVNTVTGLDPQTVLYNGKPQKVHLSNDTIKVLESKDYPWKSFWDGYELTVFDPENISHSNSVDDGSEDDDLPF